MNAPRTETSWKVFAALAAVNVFIAVIVAMTDLGLGFEFTITGVSIVLAVVLIVAFIRNSRIRKERLQARLDELNSGAT